MLVGLIEALYEPVMLSVITHHAVRFNKKVKFDGLMVCREPTGSRGQTTGCI